VAKLSPRALAVASRQNRGKATWVFAAAVATISLWLSAGGSAATSRNRIVVSGTATKTLPKSEPKSRPGNNIKFPQKTKLWCAAQPNGQPSTCTAIATLVGDGGPLNGIPLATYAHVFSSDESPVLLVFGLSQHTLDLLYKHRGDPRCTVTVAIINDLSAAGTTGTSPTTGTTPQPSTGTGVGSQSPTPARSFSAFINVPAS
jgi:hypothetical protein